ncbi:hypothetical protein EKO04_007133 [Ascochyta lentis]|uniref:Wings apart-like protein C-terminal domain-containing protein n=1 Tax=Ascochyta lentis TaxID=205686 RepID=A0A8H7IYH7_9PLEO|nr:hypothetical protein EKO04_007133 [Ascochyta lentis]
MASFMSSTFTTGERRKKVITYGKSSRLPPSRPSITAEDAPSPERPRKHTNTSNEPAKQNGGLSETARASANARATTTSPDVFDVPSEDELESQLIKPTNRPASLQRSKIETGSGPKVARKDDSAPRRQVATVARLPKQPVGLKPAETKKSSQGQVALQRPARVDALPSKPLPTSKTSQTKALQSPEGQKRAATSGRRLQRSNTSSKDVSRATTPDSPANSAVKVRSVARTTSTLPNRKATKSSTRQPASLDVFDVPLDEEEASLPIPKPPRQIARQTLKDTSKEFATTRVSSLNPPQSMLVKSHELGTLQSRKRKGSTSSITAPKSVVARTQELVIAQRDRKMAKREKGTSPGHGSTKPLVSSSVPQAATAGASISKPRRTRTRTVPVVSHPTVSKGQSSPAMLHSMVPVAQASKTPLGDVAAEALASDDTMYDIPDPMTTPIRPTPLRRTTTSTPGSVTPRQKDLFSTLLGGSAAPKTPASALASLQLTDKKPRSLLGALARSKSDLTCSSQSRKTRLIDTLRDEETSSEEDESESDEETETTTAADTTPRVKPAVIERSIDDLGVDQTAQADSQTSQISSGAVTRPRLTYAAQRSYLQEANPEDEFLISMDLDDNWKLDSQTVSTDDEDGPTSQVRTYRELKKYGQNTMFSWDMEESIREISDESNKSARRIALMDLCTKMADAGFVSQLLDSGFTHKLLQNMTSGSDVIFDFITTASVLFILQTKPAFAVVDQIYRSGVMTTLIKVVDNDVDISRIARDRKSNMSKIAQESLVDFRVLVLTAKVWSSNIPEKASPQILALKTIDLLIRSLRESGSTEGLLSPAEVSKIVNIFATSSSRIKALKASSQDFFTVDCALSILETVSIVEQDYSTWPTKILQHLAEALPVFFEDNDLSKTVEAMKLCMNLTNNKPKACQPFCIQAFIQPLLHFIVGRFDLLHSGELEAEGRTQILAALTLGLGAMINLAELSDQARHNAIDERKSVEVLVKTFVVGSERAAEADSVEESEFSVQIGFLTVLLGNLCLNNTVRSKVRASLPGQQLQPLVDQMKEFARIHEHVDKRTASRFDGPEGQAALNNYYIRIMHVVRKLEDAKD